jgi:hypothetical protein
LKLPLISKLRAIVATLEACDRGDAIDLMRAGELLKELEPILARLEVINFIKRRE